MVSGGKDITSKKALCIKCCFYTESILLTLNFVQDVINEDMEARVEKNIQDLTEQKIPPLRAGSYILVELRGFEPLTS